MKYLKSYEAIIARDDAGFIVKCTNAEDWSKSQEIAIRNGYRWRASGTELIPFLANIDGFIYLILATNKIITLSNLEDDGERYKNFTNISVDDLESILEGEKFNLF